MLCFFMLLAGALAAEHICLQIFLTLRQSLNTVAEPAIHNNGGNA